MRAPCVSPFLNTKNNPGQLWELLQTRLGQQGLNVVLVFTASFNSSVLFL